MAAPALVPTRDDRIAMFRPQYAVMQGPVQINQRQFKADTNSQTTLTYTIQAPSQDMIMSLEVPLQQTMFMQTSIACQKNATGTSDAPPDVTKQPCLGRDWGIASFPFTRVNSVQSAVVNNDSQSIQTGRIFDVLQRINDCDDERLFTTAPAALSPWLANTAPASYAVGGVMGGGAGSGQDILTSSNMGKSGGGSLMSGTGGATVGNCAFPFIQYVDHKKAPLAGSTTLTAYGAVTTSTGVSLLLEASTAPGNGYYLAADGTPVFVINGVPVLTLVSQYLKQNAITLTGAGLEILDATWNTFVAASPTSIVSVPIFLKISTVEPLFVPPFKWRKTRQLSAGLRGLDNVVLTLTMQPPNNTGGRILRTSLPISTTKMYVTEFNWPTAMDSLTTPFENPIVWAEFLTRPEGMAMPATNTVPWMEQYLYQTQQSNPVPATLAQDFEKTTFDSMNTGTASVVTNSVQLNGIPDYVIVWVAPSAYLPHEDEWKCPIRRVNIDFANHTGIMNSAPTYQLFRTTARNAFPHLTWSDFAGMTNSTFGSTLTKTPTNGSILVMQPSLDWGLPSTITSGCAGSFQLQITLDVVNYSGRPINPIINMLVSTSGFYYTSAGQSWPKRAILSSADVTAAMLAGAATTVEGARRATNGNMLDLMAGKSDASMSVSPAAPLQGTQAAILSAAPGASMGGSLMGAGIRRRRAPLHAMRRR